MTRKSPDCLRYWIELFLYYIPFPEEIWYKKYLKDASATFSCQVKKSVDVGSHIMFIAEVTEAQILNDGEVLTYAAYHEKKKVKQGWLCDVCGFIYEGEQLPEDYICPVCKVDASHLSKI